MGEGLFTAAWRTHPYTGKSTPGEQGCLEADVQVARIPIPQLLFMVSRGNGDLKQLLEVGGKGVCCQSLHFSSVPRPDGAEVEN